MIIAEWKITLVMEEADSTTGSVHIDKGRFMQGVLAGGINHVKGCHWIEEDHEPTSQQQERAGGIDKSLRTGLSGKIPWYRN